MKKHTLYCAPKNGKFNWEKISELKALPGLLEKYGRVRVTFEKYIPMKSNNQMGYYRAGILPFLHKTLYEETGMSEQEWHNALKAHVGLIENDKSGKFTKIRSLATYNEKEMSNYINDVMHTVFSFYGVQIPKPEKIDDMGVDRCQTRITSPF